MKNWANLFFIVGIAILFLTRCSKERTITIDIKNTPPGYICALLPIDEETSVVPIDTFYWKSDTTFKIKVNTKGVATSMMLWGKDVGPIFTVCGNDKFMILIDQNLYGQKFRFEGINAEARQKVHEVVSQRNPYIYEFTRDYSKYPLDNDPNKMYENFRELSDAEIMRYDSLYKKALMDEKFHDFVVHDSRVYNNMVLAKILRSEFLDNMNNIGDMKPGFGEVWSRIYTEYPVNMASLATFSGQQFGEDGVLYYGMYDNLIRGIHYPEIKDKETYLSSLYESGKRIKEYRARKTYLANGLGQFVFNNSKTYDQTIIEYLEKYMTTYPESRINGYFKDHIQVLNNYYNVLNEADSTQINFVEDMESLTTLTSVIERFKGKPLFIDFWFSTCAPCLREMKHSDGLKQWLEANDINMLYVSIDNDEMEKNWNNAIRYNKIYGNHLRATHDLHVDMDKNYGIRMYPSYMLVDASGNIVLPRTKEPSSGSELIEQLSQALDIN